MRTLAFDGRTGAAGDMICAALIAAGADPDVLAPVTDRLPVRYAVGETTKHGLRATTVDVLLDEGNDTAGDDDGGSEHDDAGSRDGNEGSDAGERDRGRDVGHDAGHDHSDRSDHDHDHASHAEGGGVHRSYPEVVSLVESMDLPAAVEATALDAFERLGRAEASIHGTDLAETRFHEVGADDAIADVVGAALLLADLDPDRVVTTPVAAGGGEVEMSHGVYPVPTPATTEIVADADVSVVGGPVERELLTPTGAAILAAVAEGVETVPDLDVDAVGYGAGDATLPDRPNVLRVLVGEEGEEGEVREESKEAATVGDHGLAHDDVAVLETNLDDAAPEVLGGLQETLSRVGARDVTIVPTTMKKSRPGHLVKVICKPADAAAVAERLARETGTLGVRQAAASHRWIAERKFETATVRIGGDDREVAVKVASTADGEVYDVSAEYDDAAAVAAETDTPVRDVLRRAETQVRERLAVDEDGDDSPDEGSGE
ncbi:nickel pincer cofactor biosynthesis protein LarC [Halorubrum sp. CBA1125]|uniref:nickel pincer cofactor biosynthesis protein LarC n=1 Tax=Halorubrum sp. CBA1125 TaxID=2668072 RepID=UPI0012E81B66|nr:nickel pincer cofactor biosynthesis protein LarC [Halorubrum sp. CBA1125]MUW14998.1 nickel pincer cofactor biosynthesis protein LarC [Halorubrum sp. CBA1125]